MDVEVIIQTCAQRRDVLHECIESVELSDIGSSYTVIENPESVPRDQFFIDVLSRMSSSEREFVVRLEDDCLVNRYILENASQWRALDQDDFGIGWLHVPQYMEDQLRRYERHTADGLFFRTSGVVYGFAATVARPDVIKEVVEAAESNLRRIPRNWEKALVHAIWRSGRRVYYHLPSLAEHRLDIPRTFNSSALTEYKHSSGERFDPFWRRDSL